MRTPILTLADGRVYRLVSEKSGSLSLRLPRWGIHLGRRYVWEPLSLRVLEEGMGASDSWMFGRGRASMGSGPYSLEYKEKPSETSSAGSSFRVLAPPEASALSYLGFDSNRNWVLRWKSAETSAGVDNWVIHGEAPEPVAVLEPPTDSQVGQLQIAHRIPSPFGSGWISVDLQGRVWEDRLPTAGQIKDFRGGMLSRLTYRRRILKESGQPIRGIASLDRYVVLLRDSGTSLLTASGNAIPLDLEMPKGEVSAPSASALSPASLQSLSEFKPRLPARSAIDPARVSPRTPELDRLEKKADEFRAALKSEVVEQDELIDVLMDAWVENELNKGSSERQHAVILVTGTTGVGKSMVIEKFAEIVLGDKKKAFIEDCNQYAAHAGSLDHHKLIGSSPGTEGQKDFQGKLPMFLRGPGKGGSILGFNEFEKANNHLSRILMEFFDTGVLQSGDGKHDSGGSFIAVLTSNQGSNKIYSRGKGAALTSRERDERKKKWKSAAVKELFLEPSSKDLNDFSHTLDPEFVERIDHAVAVGPLSIEGARKVAHLYAERLRRSNLRLGLDIEFSDALIASIVDSVYLPENGMRAVKFAVSQQFRNFRNWIRTHTKYGRRFVVDAVGQKTRERKIVITSEVLPDGSREVGEMPPLRELLNPIQDLLDPQTRDRILGLENRLQQHVFGQDEAIRLTVDAVRASRNNPKQRKPTVLAFLGSPGVGKTELARALAIEEFGDEGRMLRHEMGGVKYSRDLDKFFGAAGSGRMGVFEQFLNDFPEGGVILLDEFGNMGGEFASQKAALQMEFYSLLEEGEWCSPRGKCYSLNMFRFILATNEGQEFFQHLPSDDLQSAQWELVHDPANLKQFLVQKHGWPPAFVSRIGNNFALFRPARAADRARTAEKLVRATLGQLLDQHEVAGFDVEPGFYQQLGDAFFTHSDGARSIRQVVQQDLNILVNRALVEAYGQGLADLAQFTLGMSHSTAGKYRFSGKTPPKTEVVLTVSVSAPRADGSIWRESLSKDASRGAVKPSLLSDRMVLQIAAHEAGHHIANDPGLTGFQTVFVTVRGNQQYGGYARRERVGGEPLTTRKSRIAEMMVLLGGSAGERALGLEYSSGWSQDLARAREMASRAVIDEGLSMHALRLPLKDGKPDSGSPLVQSEIDLIVQEAVNGVTERLKKNYFEFRLFVAHLTQRGELNAEMIQAISAIAARGPKSAITSARLEKRSDQCAELLSSLYKSL